jgi:hypothetical protein
MGAEYQEPDWRVVDYQVFCLDEAIIDPSRLCPLRIRGPRPERLDTASYFACLGAAQTFGRFCEAPFPTLLARRIGYPVLNISHGGAGPSFFCKDNARLLEYLNQARFVIVQVMSGRSESSSLFESSGVGNYTRRSDGASMGCDEAFAMLLNTSSRRDVARIVRETRQSWFESYRALLGAIHVPKILFGFRLAIPITRSDMTKALLDSSGTFRSSLTPKCSRRYRALLIMRLSASPGAVSRRPCGTDSWGSPLWSAMSGPRNPGRKTGTTPVPRCTRMRPTRLSPRPGSLLEPGISLDETPHHQPGISSRCLSAGRHRQLCREYRAAAGRAGETVHVIGQRWEGAPAKRESFSRAGLWCIVSVPPTCLPMGISQSVRGLRANSMDSRTPIFPRNGFPGMPPNSPSA